MDLTENDIELIEQYLSGSLSGADAEAFEARLANEPDFAEAVDFQRNLVDATRSVGRADLKKQLQTIGAAVAAESGFDDYQPSKKPPKGGSSLGKWVVAIGVISIIFFAAYQYGAPQLKHMERPIIPLQNEQVDEEPTARPVPDKEPVVIPETRREEIVMRGRFNPIPMYRSGAGAERPKELETWIFASDLFTYHYSFGDTLKLFGEFPGELSVLEDTEQKPVKYFLRHAGKSFELKRPNHKITPLE